MSKAYKGFEPRWVKQPAPADSLRSIFRWGDPDFVKYPKESLYKMMKDTFGLTDEDFADYAVNTGFEPVDLSGHPSRMTEQQLDALRDIVGAEWVSVADYDRLSVAYGKTGFDMLRMREHRFESLPDAVVYPDTTEQVERLVQWCGQIACRSRSTAAAPPSPAVWSRSRAA